MFAVLLGHVVALRDQAALALVLLVLLLREVREAPLLRDVDLLAARDLRRPAYGFACW